MKDRRFQLALCSFLLASIAGCASQEQQLNNSEKSMSIRDSGNELFAADFKVEKVEFVPIAGVALTIEKGASLDVVRKVLASAKLVTEDVSPRYTHKLRIISNNLDETRILRFDMVNGYAQVASARRTKIYKVETLVEIRNLVEKEQKEEENGEAAH